MYDSRLPISSLSNHTEKHPRDWSVLYNGIQYPSKRQTTNKPGQ
ncbi:hypothetical protein [Bacillus cereus]|nr:hypothetical protein [Bacillus cereus]